MIQDWTQSTPGLAYQACPACRAVWYFQRSFCPRCGQAGPELRQSGGGGTVHAITLVTRAPSEDLRAHAPYAIALVDTDEGVRVMGHADPELAIGERVDCRFETLAGRLVPRFEKATT